MNFTSLLWLLIIINCVTQQEQQQPLVWMRSVFNRSTNKAILRCMHLIRVSIRIYMKLFLLTYDELRKSIISLNVGKNKVYRPIYPSWKWLCALLKCKGTDRWIKCRLAFSTNLPPCLYSFIYLTHPVIIFFSSYTQIAWFNLVGLFITVRIRVNGYCYLISTLWAWYDMCA